MNKLAIELFPGIKSLNIKKILKPQIDQDEARDIVLKINGIGNNFDNTFYFHEFKEISVTKMEVKSKGYFFCEFVNLMEIWEKELMKSCLIRGFNTFLKIDSEYVK